MTLVDLLKVLSHPTRIRILKFLVEGPGEWWSVRDLVLPLGRGVRRSVLSHHLGLLRRGGLLDRRSSGQFRYYKATTLGHDVQCRLRVIENLIEGE